MKTPAARVASERLYHPFIGWIAREHGRRPDATRGGGRSVRAAAPKNVAAESRAPGELLIGSWLRQLQILC
jgi:hypothetical protein